MKKTINVGNYYTEARLQEVKEALEQGYTVRIYVDCIGHSRTEQVEWEFREELQKEYKDKLVCKRDFADEYSLLV